MEMFHCLSGQHLQIKILTTHGSSAVVFCLFVFFFCCFHFLFIVYGKGESALAKLLSSLPVFQSWSLLCK